MWDAFSLDLKLQVVGGCWTGWLREERVEVAKVYAAGVANGEVWALPR